MEFSTYNESNLHNSLKLLYAAETDGEIEVKANGHIYDVVGKDGEVIEIQTKNLSKLLSKTLDTIDKGSKVKIVHPVVISTKILLFDEKGNKISERKSPKKGSVYNIFRELTGLYPVLLNKDFSLEIIEINMIEERIRTEIPVQSDNNRRRFKKNWIKKNKRLEEILSSKIYRNKEDYLALLPSTLPEEFCAKNLSKELSNIKELPASAAKQSYLIIWVFSRMGILEQTKVINRNHYYKIVK